MIGHDRSIYSHEQTATRERVSGGGGSLPAARTATQAVGFGQRRRREAPKPHAGHGWMTCREGPALRSRSSKKAEEALCLCPVYGVRCTGLLPVETGRVHRREDF